MKYGFSSPLFYERLKSLYILKGIDTTIRGWAISVAKEMFEIGIVEYAKVDSKGNEKTKYQQNNDLARQLKKHIFDEEPINPDEDKRYLKPPETIWIMRYCKYFNCSADYLLGFIEAPTHETTDIEKTIGLSVEAIQKLTEIEQEHHHFGDGFEISEWLRKIIASGHSICNNELSTLILSPEFEKLTVSISDTRRNYKTFKNKEVESNDYSPFDDEADLTNHKRAYEASLYNSTRKYTEILEKICEAEQ